MGYKINQHTFKVGVIRDWNSKLNPNVDLIIVYFNESIILNGDKFSNL